ncbi:MAG: ATP phosphoribosyltransferase regulatory subunit [Nitrospirae bacterium]|nr:ATP phosphoribosyltransferase regulatory subunit [Nitrospirota bacterium]MCL5285079.1 ATP phosphoribosyltransferase regulatory subunit [Nitrospirota bacterium]
MEKRKKGAGESVRPPSKTTPTGVSPVFSRTARFRRETTHRLLGHFFLWGYREIILPSFEYLDAISPGLDPSLLTKLYLMQDRGSGQVLVLRPDATAQIARLTTQSFRDRQLPLRFCYSTSVFRDENHPASLQRELQQTGLELIGDPSVVSDGEILDLCLSGAEIFPLKKPLLMLSHSGLQEALLKQVAGGPERMKDLRLAFHSRNSDRFLSFLSSRTRNSCSRILALLAGKVLGIRECQTLLKELPAEEGTEVCRETKSFLDLLDLLARSPYASSVRVDFALSPPGPYYTGMFFQMFAEDSPTHLASGGRYDHLGQAFGHDLPAVGFAFHITHIEEALRKQEGPEEFSALLLACHPPGLAGPVQDFARTLRRSGRPVMTAPDPSSDSGLPLAASSILADHAEIAGVVLYDPANGVWTLTGRKKFFRTASSIGEIAGFVLSGDLP